MPHGISLSVSGTGARTSSNGTDAAMPIGESGIVGTAFQLSVAKTGVLGRKDNLRFSVAQPLSVERGVL